MRKLDTSTLPQAPQSIANLRRSQTVENSGRACKPEPLTTSLLSISSIKSTNADRQCSQCCHPKQVCCHSYGRGSMRAPFSVALVRKRLCNWIMSGCPPEASCLYSWLPRSGPWLPWCAALNKGQTASRRSVQHGRKFATFTTRTLPYSFEPRPRLFGSPR